MCSRPSTLVDLVSDLEGKSLLLGLDARLTAALSSLLNFQQGIQSTGYDR